MDISMDISIAYLGPIGTYSENAAIAYGQYLEQTHGQKVTLHPYPSIAQALKAAAQGETLFAVVPIENSLEGGVTFTQDNLWALDNLQIQQALVLPILSALISQAQNLEQIKVVYSHPQPLGQCQGWLEKHLPWVQLIPTSSTVEAFQHLNENATTAAIASVRAAELYHLPIVAHPINDHPDNCTRFLALNLQPSPGGKYTSFAFSVPANVPGALVKPLQLLAEQGINMSRIESRPTKRSLGDYLFFIDIEANLYKDEVRSLLAELQNYTETLKVFGSYDILPRDASEPSHTPYRARFPKSR